ncbi:MAG: methyltransferase family protein [Bacteroidales bacterium]
MRPTPVDGTATTVDPATVRASVVRFVIATIVFAAILFLCAGTLAWPAAWVYLAVISAVLVEYSAIVVRLHPDLIVERRRPPADAKSWDKPLVAIVAGAGPLALLIVSGLDRRFGWTHPMSGWVNAAGLVLVAAGGALGNYAVAANRFFSALVRIQRDRGHHVVDTGPYRVVRHPGYVGSILHMFGTGLALGSLRAAAIAALVSLVLVVRTSLEDRTLHAELEGYAEYAARVRYRLVPGLW